MRGSPLLRAALALAALLLLAVPLRHLTGARPPASSPPVVGEGEIKSVHLTITSTTAPFRFEVCHLGKVIWRGEAAMNAMESFVEIPFPAEGVDLVLKAEWASGQIAAIRLGVSIDGNDSREQTAWGEGSLDEVLTFP